MRFHAGCDLRRARAADHPEARLPQAEAPRAARDLRGRLLTRGVECIRVRGGSHAEEQGRLSDAGLAAHQNHAAAHGSAAEDAIELAEPGRNARFVARAQAR